MRKTAFLLRSIYFFISVGCFAQTPHKGPVLEDFGPVWEVGTPDLKVEPKKEYRAVFDIMHSPESPIEMNKSLETAARFLNMHAQAGVPVNQLKAALVVHHTASKDIMTHTAYQERFGIPNPNAELVEALLAADVQIIFCGQSSKSRNISKPELISGVRVALSAMTALIHLQDEGYQLIKF